MSNSPENPWDFSWEEPESPDMDTNTDEDIRERIEEGFAASEVPIVAERDIRKYLRDFNVLGAAAAESKQIEDLWKGLGRDPFLVPDFSYLISENVTHEHLAQFPLAIHMDDLMYYAYRSRNPEAIRPYLLKTTMPHMTKLGIDETEYVDLCEDYTSKQGEAARYLGWLASLSCMASLPVEMKNYRKRNDIFRPPDIIDIATIAMTRLTKLQENLNGRAKNYRVTEVRKATSQQIYIRAKMGVDALYKRYGMLFLQRPKDAED